MQERNPRQILLGAQVVAPAPGPGVVNIEENIRDEQQEYRDEFNRRIAEHDEGVREWNSRPDVQEIIHQHARMVNNTNNYFTGDRRHHLLSIQIVDQAVWDVIFSAEYAYIHPDAVAYSRDIITEANESEFCVRQLEVSLLVNEHVEEGGIHEMIFFIHVYPHEATRHGHMVRYNLSQYSTQYREIQAIFNLNVNAIITECSEYDLLGLLADDYEVEMLQEDVFMVGLDSRRYVGGQYLVHPHMCAGLIRQILDVVPAVDVPDAAVAAADVVAFPPPPPPPVDDFAAIYYYYYGMAIYDGAYDDDHHHHDEYLAQVAVRRNENNQMWEDIRGGGGGGHNDHHHQDDGAAAAVAPRAQQQPPPRPQIFENQDNIIDYWLENDDRINQYLDRQEAENRRIRG